ncbi:MAG TPA: DUF4080 domain-containing protein [Thiotrichaceae bacterium]|nr:DUF4080 domain-containing protein [Thiotrichaceae bacterium]
MPTVIATCDIVLTTYTARYIHSAFGLRYLYANLGSLQDKTQLLEFTIQQRPLDVVERLLAYQPKIIGLSVYIWNVNEITQTVAMLKEIAPEVIIVLGGPEVSHYPDLPDVGELADFIIQGAGEISFYQLCDQLLNGLKPLNKIIKGEQVPLDQLKLPYQLYTEEDIRNRIIYVEASRGCPFKCEFCLSSLDKTAKPFELGKFLDEMADLYQRGARNFKFIDRTFNLKIATSIAIMEFFLERMGPEKENDLYLHFEVIPDNLPDKLKAVLTRFPPQSLQFEIGVQTFDPEIQALISRRQDNKKTSENLQWLRENTGAHIHADLLFGLPQDNLDNFAKSFDRLVKLRPQEIQLGILKRLRGAPINRHTENYQLRYNPLPPYNILSTQDIDFMTMQRVNRFARYWDMVANSGRFPTTLPLILKDQAFKHFMALSDGLFELTGSTWKIALRRLFDLIYDVICRIKDTESHETIKQALIVDYQLSGQSGLPQFVQSPLNLVQKTPKQGKANKRQQQHG